MFLIKVTVLHKEKASLKNWPIIYDHKKIKFLVNYGSLNERFIYWEKKINLGNNQHKYVAIFWVDHIDCL